jgi:hypothetical protein
MNTQTQTKQQKLKAAVKDINYWMRMVREDGCIADIADALGEFKDSYTKQGLTEEEVYREFRKQYE